MSTLNLAPIPWRFADSDLAKMWFWETEHFIVTVTSEPTSFFWELNDKVVLNNGDPRFLSEGRSTDFASAERDIREAVGKSYPPQFGYSAYAGTLATTFTLSDGKRTDLSDFNGKNCFVTVVGANGTSRNLVGYVQIVHYELQLTPTNGPPVKIQPAHISKIVREIGGGASTREDSLYTGMGRIYRGEKVPYGCNGVPGFLPNTIDHTGALCSAHESTGPKYAVKGRT